jgi:peptide/nickel transport system substrate-binding protein
MHPHTALVPVLSIVALLLAACTPAAPPSPAATPAKPSAEKPAATGAPAKPAASPAAKPAAQARKGGTLRASTLGGAPKVLHPYPETQQYTQGLVEGSTLMWNGLISIDWDSLEWRADPRGDLAREMPAISNGGRTFTFKLRDDIKWSDGKPITSADFVFAWENASKKENNYVGLNTLQRIEAFRAPDASTIEVTLKEPLARFVALTTASAIGPVPKHVWEGKPWLDPQANPEILKPSVVSGPYLPRELTAERHAYSRSPQYWGAQPNLDEVVFIQANPNTIVELLKTRQVEWAVDVPVSQYADAKRTPHVNVLEWTAATGSYRLMIFNLKRPLLSDKKVREALARAINRQDLIQFEEDLAVPQFSIFPATNTKWTNDRVEKYDFNLDRSKQLLQDAGFRLEGGVLKDKDGQPARLEIIWPTTSQPRGKMAAYAQQQWKQLGIETTVTGMEFNAWTDKYARQKDFDIAMGTYGGGSPDPDVAKSRYTSDGTQNANGYANPRVDELFAQAAVEQDDSRRKAMYDEIQKIVTDDLVNFYLVTPKSLTAFDRKVQGVSPRKGGSILYQNNGQFVEWYIAE